MPTPSLLGTPRLLPDRPVASLDEHISRGGGQALHKALAMRPDEVIDQISEAGLRGRGGAGFPTGMKWRSIGETAAAEGIDVAVVLNAAEGEPGTYKDRALLLANPYQVIEGLLIAMHAVGAPRAWIGIKASFEQPLARLTEALQETVAAGWVDDEQITIVPGPEDYLFGEEKALLEVIEGNLPMPRQVAPFVNGLFSGTAHPSLALVNNVETIANVPFIIAEGIDAFRSVGTDQSPGTMLFTVVGDVETPGVYELPLGTPLRTLLEDIAGATDIQLAVSGVSNQVVRPEWFDTPMDHESLREVGTGLGSAGWIVYDTTRCPVQIAAALGRFLADESCGQCNACHLGTGVIADLLDDLTAGEASSQQLEGLAARASRITDLARCGLPAGAQLLVMSLAVSFQEHFVQHLTQPCTDLHPVLVPKIRHLDLDTGAVTFETSA